MYTIFVLTIASMKMFVRNKQALFFSLIMPMVILLIFGSIDFDKPMEMKIGLVLHHPTAMTAAVIAKAKSAGAMELSEGTMEEEMAELKKGHLTAVVEDSAEEKLSGLPPKFTVHVNAGRPMEAQIAMSVLRQIADQTSLRASNVTPLFTLTQADETTHKPRYIEFLLPGVMAMAIMNMSVFSVAFVFARYREQGVLKRLLATPMKPYQFVTGNILTRLCMAAAQGAVFVVCGILIFKVQVAGAYWLVGVSVVLGSLMFLGLGFTISGFAKTVETVPVLANITVFPMLFVGNVFFPASSMPWWLRAVADYLPLTFFSNALRGVMTEGLGVAGIQRQLIGMAVWSVVLITLATLTFRFADKEGA